MYTILQCTKQSQLNNIFFEGIFFKSVYCRQKRYFFSICLLKEGVYRILQYTGQSELNNKIFWRRFVSKKIEEYSAILLIIKNNVNGIADNSHV